MYKILVLGAGVFGTTMASLLANKNYDVTLWDRNEEKINFLKKNRKHPNINIFIPDNLKIVNLFQEQNFDFIVLAVSAQAIREVVIKFKKFFYDYTTIVILSKGIEIKSFKRLSQVVKEEIFNKNVVALYGPTHALNIVNKEPSLMVASSEIRENALKVKDLFENDFLKIDIDDDLVGIELAASFKNCMAIAYGIIEGLGYSYNTKAALITYALNEMVSISNHFGAKYSTFLTAAGVGDLIVTCLNGRNRSVGEKLGKGLKISEIINNMSEVSEGVVTLKAIYELCKKEKIEAKIIDLLYSIIYENKDVEAILEFINK